jgi:alanine dehydrogenase
VTALDAFGVNDVYVLTHRDVTAVASPIHSARMVRFERDADNPGRSRALGESGRVPLAAYLAGFDVVVNCVLQDPSAPLMFVTGDELAAFSSGSLIVDVSCDAGMGFSWARPTSFAEPMFTVGPPYVDTLAICASIGLARRGLSMISMRSDITAGS